MIYKSTSCKPTLNLVCETFRFIQTQLSHGESIYVTAAMADVWGCGKDPNAGTDADAVSELYLVR